jgi:large subunit ribosomal protein L17
MRHKVAKKHFGRRNGPKKALIRGLVDSLVRDERIKTTLPKAKELRKHVERAITKGKKGTVHARRVILKNYPNKDTMEKIVDDLSVRFKERPGGYTRIRKLGNRPGDQAPVAYIEFVDYKPPVKDDAWVQENEKRIQSEKSLNAKRSDKLRSNKRKIQSKSRAHNFAKAK